MPGRNLISSKRLYGGSANNEKRLLISQKPDWLTGRAGELWNDLVPQLEQLGCFTKIDGQTLALLCSHYDFAYAAAEQIKREGITTIDERGLIRKHPALQILRDNSVSYLKYCTEFGLSPKSRGAIDLVVPMNEDNPVLKRLFSLDI